MASVKPKSDLPLFYSIGDASKETGVAPHIIRYWDEKFASLKPHKRADGRRYFRVEDIVTLKAIKILLHDQGLTIEGARHQLSEKSPADICSSGIEMTLIGMQGGEESLVQSPEGALEQQDLLLKDSQQDRLKGLVKILDELEVTKNRLDSLISA